MKKCYAGYVKGLGYNNWRICYLCDGRIHDTDCTAKVDPEKDCCVERHIKMGLPPEEAQARLASAQHNAHRTLRRKAARRPKVIRLAPVA
jgi:hypothetical protein